jgi:hypothetical protein
MFKPIFFSRVTLYEDELGVAPPKAIVDSSPLPEGVYYRIIGMGQVEPYTLALWQLGDGDEFVAGETLWYGETPVQTTGGQINLLAGYGQIKQPGSSVWESVDLTPFKAGVPEVLVRKLRESIVYFEL